MERNSVLTRKRFLIFFLSLILFSNALIGSRVNVKGKTESFPSSNQLEILQINYMNNVIYHENRSAFQELVIEIPDSYLSELYEKAFYSINIEGGTEREVLNEVFKDQFLEELNKYQEGYFGYYTNFSKFKIVKNDPNDQFKLILSGKIIKHKLTLHMYEEYNHWLLRYGSNLNSDLLTMHTMFLNEFTQILLESIPGSQIYQSTWNTTISLPNNSEIVNTTKDNLNWFIDFGGGNTKKSNVIIKEKNVVEIYEITEVTEQNMTSDPNVIKNNLHNYSVFNIEYYTPYSSQIDSSLTTEFIIIPTEWNVNQFFTPVTYNDNLIWPYNDGPVEAVVTADLSITIGSYIGWSWDLFGGLTDFSSWISVEPRITMSFEAFCTLDYEQTWIKQLFSYKYPLFFAIGPLIVEVDLGLTITGVVYVDLDGEIHVTASATVSGYYLTGIEWIKDSGWSTISYHTTSADHSGPDIEAHASLYVRPSLQLRLSLLFYGVVGPYVDFEPYAELDFNFYYPPPTGDWLITTNFRVSAGVDFVDWLSQLGLTHWEWVTFIDIEIQRWSGGWTGEPDPPPPPENSLIVTPFTTPSIAYPGDTIELKVIVQDDDASYIDDALVYCTILRPNGFSDVILLPGTMLSGQYSAGYSNTALLGNYYCVFEASHSSYLDGSSVSSFKIIEEPPPHDGVYRLDARKYDVSSVSYPYLLSPSVTHGGNTYSVYIVNAYDDRYHVYKNGNLIANVLVPESTFSIIDNGNFFLYSGEFFRFGDGSLFSFEVWFGTPGSGPLINPISQTVVAGEPAYYGVSITPQVTGDMPTVFILAPDGPPIDWYDPGPEYGVKFPDVDPLWFNAPFSGRQKFYRISQPWPPSFTMRIKPWPWVESGNWNFHFVNLDNEPPYVGGGVGFARGYIFLNLNIQVEALPPQMSVSTEQWNPIEPIPGQNSQLTITISETGGQTWIDDVSLSTSDLTYNGHIIPASHLTFNRNNFIVARDSSENVILTLETPSSAIPGTYTGEITIDPANVVPTTLPISLNIQPIVESTTTSISVTASSIKPGENVTLIAYVTSSGIPVDVGYVNITCSGGEFSGGVTGTSLQLQEGYASTNWTSIYPGQYDLSAYYGSQTFGNIEYQSSLDSIQVNVEKLESYTVCEISDTSINLGDSVEISGIVNITENAGIMVIETSKNGVNWTLISSGFPVAGYHNASWQPTESGDYLIRAQTMNSIIHNGSISEPESLEVRARVVNVDKTSVQVDDVITVSGPAGQVTSGATIKVFWDIAMGEDAWLLNTTTGDPDGSYDVLITVPDTVNGSHYIWVEDIATQQYFPSGAITVNRKVTVDPKRGLPGITVTVEGTGYLDEADVQVVLRNATYSDIMTTSPSTVETDKYGSFTCTFMVPNLVYGDYDVVASDDFDIANGTAAFIICRARAANIVRGNNDRIYYNVYSDSWSGWDSLPGATLNRVAGAIYDGDLHVVVKGMTGGLYHGWVDLETDVFSGWSRLSGDTPSPPVLTAASERLYLVVRGNNDRIYYCSWNGSWGSWSSLPGRTINSPGATIVGDVLHLVVVGSNGGLYNGNIDLSTSVFSGWTHISGATPSAPVLVDDESSVFLVVRGNNNRLYYREWDSGWGSWDTLPGSTDDSPGAAIYGDDLYVCVKGVSGGLYWGYEDLDTYSFSSWSKMSGDTPSSPTLCGD